VTIAQVAAFPDPAPRLDDLACRLYYISGPFCSSDMRRIFPAKWSAIGLGLEADGYADRSVWLISHRREGESFPNNIWENSGGGCWVRTNVG
jgi:hypothetical protein